MQVAIWIAVDVSLDVGLIIVWTEWKSSMVSSIILFLACSSVDKFIYQRPVVMSQFFAKFSNRLRVPTDADGSSAFQGRIGATAKG